MFVDRGIEQNAGGGSAGQALILRDARRVVAGVRRKSVRRGYSLVEILLGAAVIAAFLVRVYQAYSATSSSDQFEDFNSEVAQLSGIVIQQYSNAPDYSALANETGSAPDVVINSMPTKYVNGTNIVSVYHGTITIAPQTINNTDDAFTLTAQDLPQDACMKAIGQDFGRNFVAVATGTGGDLQAASGDLAPGSGAGQAGDPTNTATECTSTGSNNSVSWLIQ